MAERLLAFLISVFSVCCVIPPTVHAEDCARAAKLSDEAVKSISSNASLAENKLREAIAYCGKSPSLHYDLALALYRQGKYGEAKTGMEKALSLNPDYAKALNDLAWIYLKTDNDRARAVDLARKAVRLEPGNRQYLDTLDMALAEDIETPPHTSANRPNAMAVVIGNKNYKNPLIPAVEYAGRDAELMKKYLTESLGFKESNIIFFKDADNADFKKIFGDNEDYRGILYNRTRMDVSEIFIFYSGHGAPDTNTKEGYLIPSNADPFAIRFTGYAINTLYNNLSKLSDEKNPKSVVVVLDACFSGAYNNGMLIKDASPISIEISTPLLKMKNAVVFTSSQGNQISSWYPEKKHGLFTYYFIKAIKDGAEQKKLVTAGEVEKELLGNDGVNDTAWRLYNREQTPQITGDKNIVLISRQPLQ